jgi:gliding motility-associated-like protein
MINQNTTLGGNDFALDDIVFAPVCQVTDTVTVHVINLTATASPLVVNIPCDGANVTLNGTGSSTGANINYSWDTPNGNIVSGANTLMPVVNAPGSYTLTVHYEVDGHVCEKTATVNVILSPNQLLAWITPPNPIGCGSATSTLIGNTNQGGTASYQWSTLDGNIVSGENNKNCVVNQQGTYTLVVTNTNTGCTATAEVTVGLANNPPTANATGGNAISCLQNSSALSGAGSTSGAGISYAWSSPSGGTFGSPTNGLNAVASSAGTFVLAVTNTSNNCTAYDTVTIASNTTPPVLAAQTPGILDCDTDTITLQISIQPAGSTLNWTAGSGGNIASGQGTPNLSVTTAATYTLTATNPANGCTAALPVVVSANFTPPIAVIQIPDTITCTQPSLSLSGSGSSTGANISYAWTAGPGANIISGNTTLNPLINAEGVYQLLVTNTLNACTATASTTVVADTNVVKAIANATDTLDCATTQVGLSAAGSSAGGNIQYLWTTADGQIIGNPNAANPTAGTTGTYNLMVTNTSNGCTASDIALVSIDTVHPQISIQPPGLITCANPTQVIQATNLSLPGNFTYLWTAGAGGNITENGNTLTPSVNTPATYQIQATNLQNGCSSVFSTQVQQETGVPIALAAVPGPITCLQSNININTAGSSSGANFLYNWQASNGGVIVSGPNTAAPLVSSAGNYTLTITNTDNGCTATTSVTVAVDTVAPILSLQPPQTLTCYLPAETLVVTNTLNVAFQAIWTTSGTGNIVNGGNTLMPLVSASGIYHLVVSNDFNGCTADVFASVPADISTPDVVAGTQPVLNCQSPSQNLVLTNQSLPGNFSYQWTASNGGNILSGDTQLSPEVNAAGTYGLTTINLDNGCSSSENITIQIDTAAPLLLLPNPGPITCAQPVQTLSVQNQTLPGNFTYQWTASAGGALLPGNSTLLSPQVNSGGTYQLLATNNTNGCTTQIALNVPQNTQPPTVSAGPDQILSCAVNALSINASASGNGPLTYQWTASNGGNIQNGGATLTPTVNAAGTYILSVLNSANGCAAKDTTLIQADVNAPFATIALPAVLTCDLTQTTLAATASTGSGISYTWAASNGGFIVSGNNTLTPIVDAPGAYQITVTNSNNGCTKTASVTVLEDIAPPTVDAGTAATLTCAVASVSLQGTASAANGGALAYAWTGPSLTAGAGTATPAVNQPGVYTLTVENQLTGCIATDQVTVPIDTIKPQIAAVAPQILTCVQNTVPVNGTVTQPAANFTALWTTQNGTITAGQNSLNATVSDPGLYTLRVTNNQNGCQTVAAATVSENIQPPLAAASAPNTITCDAPQVSLSGSGSSTGAGFTYIWAPQAGGNIVSGGTSLQPLVSAAAGYSLTVTSLSNGCTATAQTLVNANTIPPNISIAAPGMLTCAVLQAPLTGALQPVLNNFSASWSTANGQILNGQNSLAATAGQPGLYTLTVENNLNGCTATASVTVNQNIVPPQVSAGADQEINCQQPVVSLQGSSSTTAPLQWAWSTLNGQIASGSQNATAQASAAGDYQVVVTNTQNGCTATDAVLVARIEDPEFSPSKTDPNCLNPKGSIDFGAVSLGKPAYTYSINGGAQFQASGQFAGLAPGNYTLVVKDANGCTAEADVTLDEPVFPKVDLQTFVQIQLGESIQLQPTLNIPLAQVASWLWTPADSLSCADCPSPIANPVRTNYYQLFIVDVNGCKDDARIQVRVNKRRDIFVPNIFSPNEDGENDRFTIYGKGVREIRYLKVFDRWGTEIFYAPRLPINDESAGWDGRFRGTALNPAVFVWVAEVEFIDGEVEILKGDVTLFR